MRHPFVFRLVNLYYTTKIPPMQALREFGRFIFGIQTWPSENIYEDNLAMAPTSVAIHTPERDSVYAFRCGAVVLSVNVGSQDLNTG